MNELDDMDEIKAKATVWKTLGIVCAAGVVASNLTWVYFVRMNVVAEQRFGRAADVLVNVNHRVTQLEELLAHQATIMSGDVVQSQQNSSRLDRIEHFLSEHHDYSPASEK